MKISHIRQHVINCALKWEGTPYINKQRLRGVGADCVQFLIGMGVDAGLVTVQEAAEFPMNYSPRWHWHENQEILLKIVNTFGCTEINKESRQPADLLAFKYGRVTSHVALCLPENYIIHAFWQPQGGAVKKEKLSTDMSRRMTKAYIIKGVE